MKHFEDVQEGDVVIRQLAGVVPMRLRVTKVDKKLIYCGVTGDGRDEEAWKFDRKTGVEVDDDLGWGPSYGITGSYLSAYIPAKVKA